jgi:hypothetical protein
LASANPFETWEKFGAHGASLKVRDWKLAEGEDARTNSLEVCPTSRQNALVFVSESSPPQNFSGQGEWPPHAGFGARASIALIVFPTHAFVASQSKWSARKEADMKATCMNQLELAVRWRISHRTLERWRWTGEGPKFLKVGGRVVYRMSDVEEYEQAMIRSSTSDIGNAQQADA